MRKSRVSRKCSSPLSDQRHKDVFERALGRLQVLEDDSRLAQIVEQCGDAGALGLRIVGVDQSRSVAGELQSVSRKCRRDSIDCTLQVQNELLLAELAHELR